MHEAYVISAPAKILVQIESIASYSDYVVIGTRQGHLFMYQINLSAAAAATTGTTDSPGIPAGPQIDLDLRHYNKAFSDKPIRQIDIIAEHQLLFALTNDVVSVYDMHDHKRPFPLVHRAAATKGATLFALDVKRSRSLTGETALVVRMAVAVKRKVQLWYWKNNAFLRWPTADLDVTDVPRALQWSENTVVVGLKTEYLYYDLSGSSPVKTDLFPTGSRANDPCIVQINDYFAVAKDDVLIAVQPKLTETASSAAAFSSGSQQLPVGGLSGSAFASKQQLAADAVAETFRSFVWSQPIQVFVWDEPYVVALTRNAVEVRVKATDADRDTLIQTFVDVPNARYLLRSRQGTIIVASSSTFWYMQAVDITRQRQNLLQQKRFHLALQLTEISDESAVEKLERRNHIQTAYAFDLFARKAFKESMEEFIKLQTDPCDVIRLFPDMVPNTVGFGGAAVAASSPATPAPIQLEDRDLENGLIALSTFLTDARYHVREEIKNRVTESKRFGKNLPQLQSIIDTTLLKCYLATNDSLVPSLIRSRHCHFEEAEKVLKQYRKLDELKLLYNQNGQHRKALELLRSEADKPKSRLTGHDQTVQYLQQLGPEHARLILEYAGWVLQRHPDDGLTIFTDDQVCKDHLTRAAVLDFLLRDHKSLVVRYLEHIIRVWHEDNPMFHDILFKQYLLNVNELQEELRQTNGGPDTNEQSSAAVAAALATARATLIEFLRTSQRYSGDKILKALPHNALFEERAIVLGKQQFHDKCIAVYIQILGDVEAAAAYCDSVYKADPSNDTIYVSLVEKLLYVPTVMPYTDVPLHERCLRPDLEFVLELLERYATRFNAHAVLQILPDTVPVHRLKGFLQRAMQHQLERQQTAQVMRGIMTSVRLQQQQELAVLQRRYVALSDLVVCPECGKKFTNQSAFVRLPNGRVVHHSCQPTD